MDVKRRWRGLGVLVAAFSLLVSTAPVASSHDNADQKWVLNVNGNYDWWILYKFNTTFAFPTQSHRDRFANGGFQWNNVGRDFVFVNSQSTPSPDIDVRYQDLSIFPFYMSVLGLTTNSKFFGVGEIYFSTVRINSHYMFYTGTGSPGSQPDLWSVATHELGHVVALSHSNQSPDTMWEYYDNGIGWRSLTLHDKDGISWFYPAH